MVKKIKNKSKRKYLKKIILSLEIMYSFVIDEKIKRIRALPRSTSLNFNYTRNSLQGKKKCLMINNIFFM